MERHVEIVYLIKIIMEEKSHVVSMKNSTLKLINLGKEIEIDR